MHVLNYFVKWLVSEEIRCLILYPYRPCLCFTATHPLFNSLTSPSISVCGSIFLLSQRSTSSFVSTNSLRCFGMSASSTSFLIAPEKVTSSLSMYASIFLQVSCVILAVFIMESFVGIFSTPNRHFSSSLD